MRCMGERTLSRIVRATEARRSSGDPSLRSAFQINADGGQQIDGAEKKPPRGVA